MSSAGAEDISVNKTLTGANRYFQELHSEKNICLGTLVLHILRGVSSAKNMGFI